MTETVSIQTDHVRVTLREVQGSLEVTATPDYDLGDDPHNLGATVTLSVPDGYNNRFVARAIACNAEALYEDDEKPLQNHLTMLGSKSNLKQLLEDFDRRLNRQPTETFAFADVDHAYTQRGELAGMGWERLRIHRYDIYPHDLAVITTNDIDEDTMVDLFEQFQDAANVNSDTEHFEGNFDQYVREQTGYPAFSARYTQNLNDAVEATDDQDETAATDRSGGMSP